MKKLIFTFIALYISFGVSFAQNPGSAYKDAKKTMNKVAVESDVVKKAEKLEEARQQIDIATTGISDFDDKEKPKVWLKSGEIYNELAATEFAMLSLNPDYKSKYPDAGEKASKAYMQTLEIADKKYYKNDALDGLANVSSYISNEGRNSFNAKDYKTAYTAFKTVADIDNTLKSNGRKSLFAEDTQANEHHYLTAMSALAADMYAEAKPTLEQLKAANYDAAGLYDSLYKIYKEEGNTDKALAVLAEGREKYPEDELLRVSEINYYLQEGKLDALTGKLIAAIEATPDNISLYSTLGHVYDNLHQKEFEAGNTEKALEYFDKALDYYTQALDRDGSYHNALYNAGALYYNRAAHASRELIEMDGDYSAAGLRKAEAKKSEMMGFFDKALPFFQKAESLNPSDLGTLSALKEIYARKDDLTKTSEFKTRMEKVQNGETIAKPFFE